MKKNIKWAIALAPFVLAGCSDNIDLGQNTHYATQGDDVQFAVSKAQSKDKTRTMYDDDWEHVLNQNGQGLIWGNYNSSKGDTISIYCPTNTTRGFAKYAISPRTEGDKSYAQAVVKTSEIGVQWASKGEHTFYAFYPADKASESLKDGISVITATVDNNQSPVMYKEKANTGDNMEDIESFKTYNNREFNGSSALPTPRSIYGMPNMEAAVMAANTKMGVDEFGAKVPLQFNVLADVLDITFNGPATPNTLGGNANEQNPTGTPRPYIQIQSVTIDVVKIEGDKVEEYPIDNATPITGSFNLDLAAVSQRVGDTFVDGTGTLVDKKSIVGTSTIHMTTALPESDGSGIGYPTLFVRGGSTAAKDLDHLRLRAFLIPGQITKDNLSNLRIHIQTDCGEFYQMLNTDENFATGKLYPVKLGYFKTAGADFNLSKWIGQLNPKIYISELSIPGAWHAANTDYQGSVSLQDMYNAGIRAFEVHTKNGPILRKNGDMGVEFNIDESEENFEQPFTYPSRTTVTLENITGASGSGTVSTGQSYTYNGKTYDRYRNATARATVTRITDKNAVITVPKFWIRLYRTSDNVSTGTPLSQAIIDLAGNMNPEGLMFLELGMNSESDIPNVPYRKFESDRTVEYATNVTIKGKQWGTSNGLWNSWSDGVYTWDTSELTLSNPQVTETPNYESTEGTFTLSGREAWAIAVRSCLERLYSTINTKTQKSILYTGDLDRFTTIEKVQGHVIAKINTNDAEEGANEKSYLWGTETPALFSRWTAGSGTSPLTINLEWKKPIAPNEANGSLHDGLRWCFTELDNIGSKTNIEGRQKAITAMNDTAYNNYKLGWHRTFYESHIGGYYGGNSIAEGCQNVAKQMNPWVINRLSNPNRQNVPLGLVFMNYVIPPTGEEDTYKSAELIRAIVNNNKAFMLHREGDVEQHSGE